MFLNEDTDPLIALIYARGLEIGGEREGSRADCPFCHDRLELCQAWLAGFSVGRLARDQVLKSAAVARNKYQILLRPDQPRPNYDRKLPECFKMVSGLAPQMPSSRSTHREA